MSAHIFLSFSIVILIFGIYIFYLPSTRAAITVKSTAVNSLTQGMVGYWNFDEGQGNTAHDYSGKGNTGTLTNFGSSEQPWVQGNTGQGDAIKFDGADDTAIR